VEETLLEMTVEMETRNQLHREYGEDECGDGLGQCPPKRGNGKGKIHRVDPKFAS
jgi:hypothetical protein